MKTWFRLFSLMMGLLLLLACSSQGGGETAVSSATESTDAVAEPSESQPVDPNRLYGVSDLSQVANTGRPQFLNSFANW